jgi:hypothetical protein
VNLTISPFKPMVLDVTPKPVFNKNTILIKYSPKYATEIKFDL